MGSFKKTLLSDYNSELTGTYSNLTVVVFHDTFSLHSLCLAECLLTGVAAVVPFMGYLAQVLQGHCENALKLLSDRQVALIMVIIWD